MALRSTAPVAQRATEMLSALPYFDLETGAEVVALLGEEIDRSITFDWASQYVFDLAASGVLEPIKDLFRVPERVRAASLPDPLDGEASLPRRALQVFVAHAGGSLAASLKAVMGVRATEVLVRSIQVVAEPDENSHLDQLITLLQDSERLERDSDPASAVAILGRYIDESDRRLQLLHGLTAWQRGQHREAARYFESVLAVKIKDRAEGIAAHLLSIVRHDSGDDRAALTLLRRSERALRNIDDERGLSLTHTTHGRVLSQLGKDGDPERLTEALVEFKRAQAALDATPADDADRVQSAGMIRLHEAETYSALEQYDVAIELARAGQEAFPPSSSRNLYAAMTLARILRDAGKSDLALATLNEATIERFQAAHSRHLIVAQARNILASILLREGDIDGARREAELSVQIGVELDLRKHLAHALLTLARIRIEQLGAEPQREALMEVRSLLYRAQKEGAVVDSYLRSLPLQVSAERRVVAAEREDPSGPGLAITAE